MQRLLACFLLACLLGLGVVADVPVCLKSFTLIDSRSYRAVYMACSNGEFVDLGSSKEHLQVQIFNPPKELEELMSYYETLDCNVRGETSYGSNDVILGSFQIRGSDFDREKIVGLRVDGKFLVQFVRCPKTEPMMSITPEPYGKEIAQPPAVGSRVSHTFMET